MAYWWEFYLHAIDCAHKWRMSCHAIDAPLSTRRVPRAALPALLYGGAFLAKDLGALFDVHIPYVSDRTQGIAHGAHVGGTLV